MSYFVYKLNVQPDILNIYKKNDELSHLISHVIPTIFDNVLETKKHGKLYKIIPPKNDEELFQKLFESLEKDTLELHELYTEIFSKYKKNHEIHYSQEFLKLNDLCMSKRRDLEKNYHGIVKAYQLISDDEIESLKKIESDNKVGTGITHLKKFFKIQVYLDRFQQNQVINLMDLIAYYNPYTEHILVETSSESAAQDYVNALVDLINNNKTSNEIIGKININPIYESISLNGDYTEIVYTIVYPNGNPPLDRHNILKNSGAKESTTTLLASDGKPLKIEPVNELVEKEGKLGYLKSLKVKGKGMLKKIKVLQQIDESS